MKKIFAALSVIALAACSQADEPPTDLEVATTDGEAEALARNIEAGDFADLTIGQKIRGPQGLEVESALSTPEGNFADMRSYVLCPYPEGVSPDVELPESCDLDNQPVGTVYTYVHVVIPGEDNDPSTGSGEANDSSDVERATRFRMIRPSTGFTGKAGYSKDEAMAAVGAKADVVITCDEGALVWTVNGGDGGDQWEQGEPLTFWWQSTVPPAGPADAYAIDANYTQASGKGPYPGEDAAAKNFCTNPAVSGE